MPFANLHTHTLWSDGLISAGRLLDHVLAQPGLEVFSLNDHDSLSGLEPLFRAMNKKREQGRTTPRFLPGIELTLEEPAARLIVHLLGYFPWLDQDNHRDGLARIDAVLGDYCLLRCRMRGVRDVDARVDEAFRLNLDGLADQYSSPDEVKRIVRDLAARRHAALYTEEAKNGDVIAHPIPLTYQALIEAWEDLLPASSQERIRLYVLRPMENRRKKLAGLLMEQDGLSDVEAGRVAQNLQGSLYTFQRPSTDFLAPQQGLDLLKRAGAVVFLAHPAVDHAQVSYDDFDRAVARPLIEQGLNGLEVYYPYDRTYRQEAIDRYGQMALDHGLLVSGGTDYHGDGRTRLDEVPLALEHADRIFNFPDYDGPPRRPGQSI
ncbi:MAG: hypothetical protein AB1641_24405 [Thermodesulfobacteriota bacterium]